MPRRVTKEEKGAGDPFDRIYCVFDKDTHDTYQNTLDSIAQATPKGVFFAINSVPCFEYWLLLHFLRTTKAYEPLPGSSACNQVLNDLKCYLPHYAKGIKKVLSKLINRE
uniref:RloB-like protein n=1 Tax=Candidatus Kentrum sp. TUN TaxID=2126343 RepID=A0A450ZGH2_9GAMM|nr:MAG: RloB-like protein [Candidatus Kentron sp. TUN]VFK52912.1 MAG: RloB-like protein [Candidatus Kentron sp. TUN]